MKTLTKAEAAEAATRAAEAVKAAVDTLLDQGEKQVTP